MTDNATRTRDTGAEINYKRCTRKYTYNVPIRCICIEYYTFVSVQFCHARERYMYIEEKKNKLKTISITRTRDA